ncbi:MAG: exo-alpha-sialidase [Victivallales bacterium]|nr:exo-alpha-sialidase [Victivallales bacterium]
MNLTHESLRPVAVTQPGPRNEPSLRTHQGIPSIECLPSGRLFVTWYCGGTTECRDNYVTLAFSDDGGLTWSEANVVIDPPYPDVRAFDPALWLAPDGRLLWFWAQGCGGPDIPPPRLDEVFDGLVGVWFTTILNPDDPPEKLRFSPSRRVADGVMVNKPTVLPDGGWALPCSLWSFPCPHRPFHAALHPVYGASCIVTEDNGDTFHRRGTLDVSARPVPPTFDEHQFLVLSDGGLACYVRCKDGIGRSVSTDQGHSWGLLETNIAFAQDCRFHIRRLASGRVLLIACTGGIIREKLTAFLSEDEGMTWPHRLLLDPRQNVSYPDAAVSSAGDICIVYDHERSRGGFLYLARIAEEDILSGTLSSPCSFLHREICHSRPVPTSTA